MNELHSMNSPLFRVLLERGWTEIQRGGEYRKGHWIVILDTGSFVQTGTIDGPRMEIPFPSKYVVESVVSNIERFCSIEDERQRLLNALRSLKEVDSMNEVRRIAQDALVTTPSDWWMESDFSPRS